MQPLPSHRRNLGVGVGLGGRRLQRRFGRIDLTRLPASGDPRPSIEERYPSFAMYEAKVRAAVEDMVSKRLMLREDAQPAVDRLLRAGQATGAMK